MGNLSISKIPFGGNFPLAPIAEGTDRTLIYRSTTGQNYALRIDTISEFISSQLMPYIQGSFRGLATTTTDPGTPTSPESWIAGEEGTYVNFDNLTVSLDGQVVYLVFTPGAGWEMIEVPIDVSGLVTDAEFADYKVEVDESIGEVAESPGVKYATVVDGENVYFGDINGNYWFKSSPTGTEYIGQITQDDIDQVQNDLNQYKLDVTAEISEVSESAGVKYTTIVDGENFYIGDPEGNYWFKSGPNGTEYMGQVSDAELEEIKNSPGVKNIVEVDGEVVRFGDALGNYWFESGPQGTNYIGKLTISEVIAAIQGGSELSYFDADVTQIIAYGQSLSVAGTGFDSLDFFNTKMFGGGILTNYDPDVPSEVTAYYNGGIVDMAPTGTESAKSAGLTLGKMIQSINGIQKADQNYDILINAPGFGGAAYSQLAATGGDYYGRLIESVEKANDLSIAAGKSFAVTALMWIQGENSADKNKTEQQVYDDLTSLFDNLNTDIKAITNQERDVQFFPYQIASYSVNSGSVDMPLAQLRCALEVENIHFGTAMYQMPYSDALHLTGGGYRMMWSTIAAQIYHGVILRKKRSPILPESWTVNSSTNGSNHLIQVKFKVPVKPLVFDTDFYPSQTNMGFSILNGSSSEIITGVTIVRDDTINITCSQDPTGLELTYAIGGRSNGGNLRDSQGNSLTIPYGSTLYRLDNWAPIFKQVI